MRLVLLIRLRVVLSTTGFTLQRGCIVTAFVVQHFVRLSWFDRFGRLLCCRLVHMQMDDNSTFHFSFVFYRVGLVSLTAGPLIVILIGGVAPVRVIFSRC